MIADDRTVLVEREGGVATITLNRPEKKNAFHAAMLEELLAAFRTAMDTPADRAIVLTGAGEDFCSGVDLSGLDASGTHPLDGMRRAAEVALAIHQCPKPVLAKVRGVALGAGCNLALACDLVVAAEDARISQLFSRRGLSVDFGGSWLLPRLVGLHRAKELVLLADMLTGQEAATLGLVNRAVDPVELDEFVDGWARRLAEGPPIAMSLSKRMLNDALQTSMAQALEQESVSQVVNMATADLSEAMQAHQERRSPSFAGRSILRVDLDTTRRP